MTRKQIPYHEVSSGNVFADLGLPDAPELQAKADLAFEISRTIDQRGLTQNEAAEILGVDQPKVSALVRGRLDGFSMERLYRFLNALGKDVEIVVRPTTGGAADAHIRVTTVRGMAPSRPRTKPPGRRSKRPRTKAGK
jgi:predicted XRE-type DNA-binding protein